MKPQTIDKEKTMKLSPNVSELVREKKITGKGFPPPVRGSSPTRRLASRAQPMDLIKHAP